MNNILMNYESPAYEGEGQENPEDDNLNINGFNDCNSIFLIIY